MLYLFLIIKKTIFLLDIRKNTVKIPNKYRSIVEFAMTIIALKYTLQLLLLPERKGRRKIENQPNSGTQHRRKSEVHRQKMKSYNCPRRRPWNIRRRFQRQYQGYHFRRRWEN